jgi:hypothetical protein
MVMTEPNTNGTTLPKALNHDPSEPSVKHIFECSHCRGSFEKVKMCSAVRLCSPRRYAGWLTGIRLVQSGQLLLKNGMYGVRKALYA